jgi:hypothetical protein
MGLTHLNQTTLFPKTQLTEPFLVLRTMTFFPFQGLKGALHNALCFKNLVMISVAVRLAHRRTQKLRGVDIHATLTHGYFTVCEG